MKDLTELAADEKQKQKVESDIEEFREAVQNADIEVIGHDPDYVPDCPRLKEQMGKEGEQSTMEKRLEGRE